MPTELNSSSPKVKVLVVEHYHPIRQLITELLEEQGFDVIGENDAYHAIELAKFAKPNIVITELRFDHSEHPNVDGFMLLEQLRRFGVEAPIIALSVDTLVHGVRDLKIKGFHDALPKPFENIDQVVAAVRNALS